MLEIIVTSKGQNLEVVNGARRLEAMIGAFGKATVLIDGVEATVTRSAAGGLVVLESEPPAGQ